MQGQALNKFDTIIIGGGPAGLTAAIYAVRKNLKVLLIAKMIGGSEINAASIENYLGFSVIRGVDLAAKFREDVERFSGEGITIVEGTEVLEINGQYPEITVKTVSQEYVGKTLIIASGRIPQMLNIPGEKEFFGRGVAVCATCDAPLYKDKDVVVIGGGNAALDAGLALSKTARSVSFINNLPEFTADEIQINKIKTSQNIKIFNNHKALEILGEQVVSDIKIKDEISAKESVLPVQGVFIEVGYTPSNNFDKITNKDEKGYIIVDENGATSVEGIWAAGDVNNLLGEQIIIAAGEGAKVALTLHRYLLINE